MTRVIDASVACKWFFDEQGWEEARKILTAGPVVAPDLIVAEVTNVAWRRVVQAEIGIAQARAAVAGLINVMDQLVPAASHGENALAIAHALNHPAGPGGDYGHRRSNLAETGRADALATFRDTPLALSANESTARVSFRS